MIKTLNEVFKNKSLLGNYWKLIDLEERFILSLSQKNKIHPTLAKLLILRGVNNESLSNFLNPNINKDLPNPFLLKDMNYSIDRVIKAIINNEVIGIIADYDVDGSTSASILFKFLSHFKIKIILKTPNRLAEGYGPNIRIMDELYNEKVNLIFTLDCGTSSFDIIDKDKYNEIDIIIIDHHLSETTLPNVFSIINPNRFDEKDKFKDMAAVGVTFLFLMGLRKKLREQNFFNKKIIQPNLLSYLDLVALGTVCDVVKLNSYNRMFVKLGLNVIKLRKNLGITQLIDNSNFYSIPTATDLGYIIGPQLNAASRIGDSSLPLKILTSNNIVEIESISRKLILLNEKRKLIENIIYEEALSQAIKQKKQKYILVYGKDWHKGVLGIVASRLIAKFNKPAIVISFNNLIGTGSARSIINIDIGSIILNAKNKNLLLKGGGHVMAAGLQINFGLLNEFKLFLTQNFKHFSPSIFKKIEKFDSTLSVNEISNELLELIEQIEPFGNGNPEPKFIINDLIINHVKIIKAKHILVFFQNDSLSNLRAICFNCMGSDLGEHLLNFRNFKFYFSCSIKKNNFYETLQPQIIIKDAMIIN